MIPPGDGDTPVVTICIPTIGRLEYLEVTVQAALGQTFDSTEILILDNASPEPARGRIDEFERRHSRLRVLRTDERLSMFPNFNRGIEAARGEFITFFHDDDIYSPDFVEHFLSLLRANPKAVFAGGNFSIVDESGRVTRQHNQIKNTGYWTGEQFIEDLVRRGRSTLPTPGIMFRSGPLKETGFDPDLPFNWGDFTIFMRLAERGPVAVSKSVRYGWRVHGANNSNIPHSISIQTRREVIAGYLAEHAARFPSADQFRQKLRRYMVRSHKQGLLWGWATATSEADAAECRSMLDAAMGWIPAGAMLKLVEMLGLSLDRRREIAFSFRSLKQRVKQ